MKEALPSGTSARDEIEVLRFAGTTLAIIGIFSTISKLTSASWESSPTVFRQWLAIGILGVAYVAVSAVPSLLAAAQLRRSRSPRIERSGTAPLTARYKPMMMVLFDRFVRYVDRLLGWQIMSVRLGTIIRIIDHAILLVIVLSTAAWLIVATHRAVALTIGTLQTVVLYRLLPDGRRSLLWTLMVGTMSIAAWTLAAGYSYTPLNDWLLAAVPTTGLAPLAFAAAFAIVLAEIGTSCNSMPRFTLPRMLVLSIAAAACIALALRTDHLLTDWVPYHRSFWVGSADFVRQGAWLLWDIPSQYGFASQLSLAVWPTRSTWEALYIETAVALVIVALILFALFRYRRSGWRNALFALVATTSLVFSSQGARFPFGWRLYPQVGLRFPLLVMILGVIFLVHVARAKPRRYLGFTALGHAIWAISLAWSFECGVFATLAWGAFIIGEAALSAATERLHGRFGRFVARVAPLVVIPVALAGVTELVYRHALHHGPDWSAFVEFSLAYEHDASLAQPVLVYGPAWMALLLLIGMGSVAITIVRKRRYECVPVAAACWFTAWGASLYYVGEPYNEHITSLAPVYAVVIAVLFAIGRTAHDSEIIPTSAKATFVPLLVLVAAFAYGEPGHIRTVRFPTLTLNSTADFPWVTGEVAQLFARDHIEANDDVVLSVNSYETKIAEGMVLPFIREGNHLVQQTAWLPLSPAGPFDTLFTLPFERRDAYLRRYFRDVGRLGFLVTYHQPVDCRLLLPQLSTVDIVSTTNYELGRCVLTKQATSHLEAR